MRYRSIATIDFEVEAKSKKGAIKVIEESIQSNLSSIPGCQWTVGEPERLPDEEED